jgi:TonB family protein
MSSGTLTSPVLHVRMTDRQKIVAALVASILVHLLIFLFIWIWDILPSHAKKDKTLDNLKMVSLTVATPTPVPVVILPMAPPEPPPVIDSDDLHKTDKAPNKPVFESDQNLEAGSKQPATGNVPLPSQEGVNHPELAFSTHKFKPGSDTRTDAPPVMHLAPAPDVPQAPPMKATAPPLPTPAPVAQPTPKVEQSVPVATPTPAAATPVPTPAATPVPAIAAEPIYRPTPIPMASVAPTPDLAHPTPVQMPTPAPQLAMLATPRPNPPVEQVQPKKPGFVPETEQNKIEGSISNRSEPGVNAVATPKGRYEKRIADSIKSLWQYYMAENNDLVNAGTVVIRFYINEKGEVEDPEILSNTSNEPMANFSLAAIQKAKLLPPPSDLEASLDNGRFEVTFTFTRYPYQ